MVGIVYSTALLSGIIEDYFTSAPLTALDTHFVHLLYTFRTMSLLSFFYGVTLLAQTPVVIVCSFLLTILLWMQRQRLLVLTLGIAVIGSQMVTMLGKFLFHRLRPAGLLPAIVEDSFSFPSGHATSAVAFYGFLVYLVLRFAKSWKAKMSGLFMGGAIIFLIDFSRLYLGVHYLSDVLAGNIVGLILLLFAVSTTEWLHSRQATPIAPLSLWNTLAVTLGIAVLTVFGFVFFVDPSWSTSPHGQEPMITGEGVPTTIFLVVPSERCIVSVLEKAGWQRMEGISLSSLLTLTKAAFLHTTYTTAPTIPFFYDTQPPDLGFTKEIETNGVRSRHYVRFWKTQDQQPEGQLFVGTASLGSSEMGMARERIMADLQECNAP